MYNVALRKIMVRAHRQAWAWQDEWYGLTMDDIREIERQTQLALQKKMGNENCEDDEEEDDNEDEDDVDDEDDDEEYGMLTLLNNKK